ncbi:hypothetical protein TNCV_2961821 [Trichonephila clavipes]|nr:hypothetical protein TNCV_2961821 [Trichonephila clavipes]
MAHAHCRLIPPNVSRGILSFPFRGVSPPPVATGVKRSPKRLSVIGSFAPSPPPPLVHSQQMCCLSDRNAAPVPVGIHQQFLSQNFNVEYTT